MYITNNPVVARIAENAGVDWIFLDMEVIGKAFRQTGLDTVQNHHTVLSPYERLPFSYHLQARSPSWKNHCLILLCQEELFVFFCTQNEMLKLLLCGQHISGGWLDGRKFSKQHAKRWPGFCITRF